MSHDDIGEDVCLFEGLPQHGHDDNVTGRQECRDNQSFCNLLSVGCMEGSCSLYGLFVYCIFVDLTRTLAVMELRDLDQPSSPSLSILILFAFLRENRTL